MRKDDLFGRLAISMAGHDKGELFVMIGEEAEYVILADGKSRTVEHPKRKKKKHIRRLNYRCNTLEEAKEASRNITNEMLKYELKQYRKTVGNGGCYVESRCSRD